MSPAPIMVTGKRSVRNSVWQLMIPAVLLVLVIGTTLGEVWHRHVNSSPETCPICHLSHQAVEPAVPSVRAEILVPEGPALEAQQIASQPRLVVPRLPARAPPV